MRRIGCAAALLATLAVPAQAKDMQTDNDDDHSVSADERLKITGVAPGRYDVKLVDKTGRTCIVRDVEAKAAGKVAFSIAEKQLTDCTP